MIAAQDVIQRIHAAGLWLHRYAQTFDVATLDKAERNLRDALAMVEVMRVEEPKRIQSEGKAA